MSDDERVRWDRRYATVQAGEPTPPTVLADRTALLPSGGRALDVACGRGTVAVWLALRGFGVDAVDVSPEALARGRSLAARYGVDVRFVAADLDDGLPFAGPYDLVVQQRFRDPALYPALASVLAPGGLLAVSVLSSVGDEGGRFRAAPGELASAFADLDVLHHVEELGEAHLVGRKPASPRRRAPLTR